MWVYLDKLGNVLEYYTGDGAARAGTTEFKIVIALDEEIDIEKYPIASIKLYRPDLQNNSYPLFPMSRELNVVFPYNTPNPSSHFIKNKVYNCFTLDFSDFEIDDTKISLLDTAGLWRAAVTLVGSGVLNVVGSITFNVEIGNESENLPSSEETLDLALTQMFLALSSSIDSLGLSYVSYLPNQILTPFQKATARANIGAGTSNFSGNYNDLTNKPVLFSGNYNDLTNKPNIPNKTSQLTNDGDGNSPFATQSYVSSIAVGSIRFKGTVDDLAALVAITNKEQGDEYWVTSESSYYIWNGSSWSAAGGTTDLSNYVTLDSNQTIYGEKRFGSDATFDNDIYVRGGIIISGDIIPAPGEDTLYIGSTSLPFERVYTEGVYFDGGNLVLLENNGSLCLDNGNEQHILATQDWVGEELPDMTYVAKTNITNNFTHPQKVDEYVTVYDDAYNANDRKCADYTERGVVQYAQNKTTGVNGNLYTLLFPFDADGGSDYFATQSYVKDNSIYVNGGQNFSLSTKLEDVFQYFYNAQYQNYDRIRIIKIDGDDYIGNISPFSTDKATFDLTKINSIGQDRFSTEYSTEPSKTATFNDILINTYRANFIVEKNGIYVANNTTSPLGTSEIMFSKDNNAFYRKVSGTWQLLDLSANLGQGSASSYVNQFGDQTIYGRKTFELGVGAGGAFRVSVNLTGVDYSAVLGGYDTNKVALISLANYYNDAEGRLQLYVDTQEDEGVIDFSINDPYDTDYHGRIQKLKTLDVLNIEAMNPIVKSGYIGSGYEWYDDHEDEWRGNKTYYFLPNFEYDQWDNPYPTINNGEVEITKSKENTLALQKDCDTKMSTVITKYYDDDLDEVVNITFNDLFNGYYTKHNGDRVSFALNTKYSSGAMTNDPSITYEHKTMSFFVDNVDEEDAIFLVNLDIWKYSDNSMNIGIRYTCPLPRVRNNSGYPGDEIDFIHKNFNDLQKMYANSYYGNMTNVAISSVITQNKLKKYYPERNFIGFGKYANTSFGYLRIGEASVVEDDAAHYPSYSVGMLVSNDDTRTTKGMRVGRLKNTKAGNSILFTSQEIITKYGNNQANNPWIISGDIDLSKEISIEDVLKLFEDRVFDSYANDSPNLTKHMEKKHYIFNHTFSSDQDRSDYFDLLQRFLGADGRGRLFKTGTTPKYNPIRCVKFTLKFVNNLVRETHTKTVNGTPRTATYWSGVMANAYLEVLVWTSDRTYDANNKLTSCKTNYVLIPRRFAEK